MCKVVTTKTKQYITCYHYNWMKIKMLKIYYNVQNSLNLEIYHAYINIKKYLKEECKMLCIYFVSLNVCTPILWFGMKSIFATPIRVFAFHNLLIPTHSDHIWCNREINLGWLFNNRCPWLNWFATCTLHHTKVLKRTPVWGSRTQTSWVYLFQRKHTTINILRNVNLTTETGVELNICSLVITSHIHALQLRPCWTWQVV